MMLLYKIGESEIESAVSPVGLEQMVDILGGGDVYVAYCRGVVSFGLPLQRLDTKADFISYRTSSESP